MDTVLYYVCIPLGILMKWCWQLVENYGVAIILFTLATKLVLLPVLASLGDGKHLEGLPQPAKDLGFMDRLTKLSAPFGVNIKMENGLGVCSW